MRTLNLITYKYNNNSQFSCFNYYIRSSRVPYSSYTVQVQVEYPDASASGLDGLEFHQQFVPLRLC